ncbi:hypothetical protein BJX62DRAFT_212622 [Aspergillus germanicus]
MQIFPRKQRKLFLTNKQHRRIPKLFPKPPDLTAERLRHGPPTVNPHLVFDFKNQPRDGI